MNKKQLLIQQLDQKISLYNELFKITKPQKGWVKTIRTALGISLEQIAKKMHITKQSVRAIEEREKEGTITLKSLQEVAHILDMKLIYALVPKDGSLDALIERKAKELAIKIVQRTSASMKLEDQENSKERIEKAIQEKTEELKREMPKILWD